MASQNEKDEKDEKDEKEWKSLIDNGPSKWDLVMALFERLRPSFLLRNTPKGIPHKVRVSILRVGKPQPLASRIWQIEGVILGTPFKFVGFYSTEGRTGTIICQS